MQQDLTKRQFMRIGVDTGGTFTDFVAIVDGTLRIDKRFSTPDDPARAILGGLIGLQSAASGPIALAHGTTIATNTILERSGARTAFITTAGFRDMLYLGRQNRPVLYALHPQIVLPLVPREHCYEARERLDFRGEVLTALDLAALDVVIQELQAERVDSIAVCLLYSYVNPIHEQMIRERLRAAGYSDAQIALSSDILPEFREYERASTVTLEAFVRPRVQRYLKNLEAALPASCQLRIMKSDGGIVSASKAGERAIQTALSGPAAGVIGAFHLAKMAGFDHIITLDIGGTSTDVALCPGILSRFPEREIDGLSLRTSTLDIETIGAGGGSIARLDAGGALRVGPESAGASPGSIIYGKGGQQVTLSDANAVLERLDADHFLGGGITLAVEATRDAMDQLAVQMRTDRITAAAGIIQIANIKIDQAIRRVSVARGYDPRDFTLVAFGGAGPLHACEVAMQLDIDRVLIPRYPGAMCALGLLIADVVIEHSQSVLGIGSDSPQLAQQSARLKDRVQADLRHEGIPEADTSYTMWIDVRYRGQAYELSVPFTADFEVSFHKAHEQRYGYAMVGRRLEVVTLRVQGVGFVDKPPLDALPIVQHTAIPIGQKELPIVGHTDLFERETLRPGALLHGPALIFQFDSTVYLPPGWNASVDGFLNLIARPTQETIS